MMKHSRQREINSEEETKGSKVVLNDSLQTYFDARRDLILLPDQISTNKGHKDKSTLKPELKERVNFYKSFSPQELQVEGLVTTSNLQEVDLIAPHQDIAHLSMKETVYEALKGDPEDVREAIANFVEDNFDYDGPIKLTKKRTGLSNDGTNKKAKMEAKEKVQQLVASRRQRTELPLLPPTPFTLPIKPAQLTEGEEARLEAVDKFYYQRRSCEMEMRKLSTSISSRRNTKFVDYDKWNETAPPIMNRAELAERLHPRVGTNLSPFLAYLLEQGATTSCKLDVDKFAMIASRDSMYVIDFVRAQANIIALMAERSCSLVTQLEYDLEVLKAKHGNA
uniref:Uncharacterized protein n=1 Tax=Cannabis sativa TaxID=3483 RepID=A0A803QHM4_CANSA